MPNPKRRSPGIAQAVAASLSVSKKSLYEMLARKGGLELVALRLKNQALVRKKTTYKIVLNQRPRLEATVSVKTLDLARAFGHNS